MHSIINKLETQGKLKRQHVGMVQIEALLRQAMLDLAEAQKIAAVAERATFLLAYMAMLKAGRALLLSHGYVPDDGAQHKTVVEVTSALLGSTYTHLTNHFEMMRRTRNEMTYEAGALISLSESKHAFVDAQNLVNHVYKDLKSKNPQMELDLNI